MASSSASHFIEVSASAAGGAWNGTASILATTGLTNTERFKWIQYHKRWKIGVNSRAAKCLAIKI